MDSKLLLVKVVTLLYRESQLKNRADNPGELVRSVLSTIKNPTIIVDTDFGREVISSFKKTVSWMLEYPLDTEFDKTELLQRIRVNVGDNDNLYTAVHDGIADELSQDDVQKVCVRIRKELNEYLQRLQIKEILKESSNRANFQEDSIDWRYFIPELVEKLEPFSTPSTDAHSAVVDDIDLNDTAALGAIMSRGKSELSTEGVLKFGCQAINRMFGESRGIRRGEFMVHAGLQHNYKSGLNLMLMKQMALYNFPALRDPSRKPMILRITFENSASDDILWLYKSLVENETKLEVSLADVNTEEAAEYVKEKLQETGFTLKVMRIDPSSYTYHDLFELINKLESENFEIVACFCDYLNMMSKLGCTTGPAGTEIRDLFRRVRNFMSRKAIAFITPHQLSTEAKMLLRMGADNFVQEIANKGYYDSCRTIDQEVDIEIYHHIVKVNDESYLTLQRGKHRKPSITPERDLYTVLKFEPVGGILDDINDRDLSRRQVGGGAIADGAAQPWF